MPVIEPGVGCNAVQLLSEGPSAASDGTQTLHCRGTVRLVTLRFSHLRSAASGPFAASMLLLLLLTLMAGASALLHVVVLQHMKPHPQAQKDTLQC